MSRQIDHEYVRTLRSGEELGAAIRQSDRGAFAVLFERYYRRLYDFVYLRLRKHADIEAAVRDALAAVFQVVASFCGRSPVLSWVYGIAKNTAIETGHPASIGSGTERSLA